MPVINEAVTIGADIKAVFDLISRIEEFPRYTTALKEVRQIGPRTYRWTAQVAGMTLEWDSVVTDYLRPTRIAWRSIKGFANAGAYCLASIPGGTEVSLTIEYSFPNRLVAMLLAPLVARLFRAYAGETLRRVKQQLEGGDIGRDDKRIRIHFWSKSPKLRAEMKEGKADYECFGSRAVAPPRLARRHRTRTRYTRDDPDTSALGILQNP